MSGDPFALEGVAVVTGASSGIGAHFARLLVGRGMTVVAAARRVGRLRALESSTAGVVACECDVADDRDLARLVEVAVARGPLHLVVNNAGISDAPAKAIEEDPSVFRRVVDVNLNATFVLSSLAASAMVADGLSGSIVNIASVYGMVSSAPNTQAGYVASKAGVIGLTKELAAQWARHGIRVNAIAPGFFHSEMTHDMLDSEAGSAWVERGTLLRRSGELGELDGPLLLLASDAGAYMTGQTIAVDGGWTTR